MKIINCLLIICIFMTSCTHVYYAPNTANAPLLSEKGETRINALYCYGGDTEIGGGEIQVAHAISKKFALMINGYSAGKSEDVSKWNGSGYVSHNENGKGSYIEFAGGLFTKLDPRSKWVGDVYSGFGFGSTNHEYAFNEISKVNLTKFFIQPSLGYKGRHFEFAVVPKLSFINWKVKENNISHTDNNEHKTDLNSIQNKNNFMSFEPALILRVGSQDVKFQGGLSFSTHDLSSYYTSSLIESVTASLGLTINFKTGK